MSTLRTLLIAVIVATAAGPEQVGAETPSVTIVVKAGATTRRDTPVRFDLPLERLGLAAEQGVKPLRIQERRDGKPVGDPGVAEVDFGPEGKEKRQSGGHALATFFLPGETPAHAERTFRIEPLASTENGIPWTLSDASSGRLDLENRRRPVFRYNLALVGNHDFPKVPARAAYIHPAYTPSGAVITGDFSKSHPHHRGFFFAYAKSQVGDAHPDFWNIHNGTGSIAFDSLDRATTGPLTARIVTRHRWEAKGAGTVLRERWEVVVYDVPGSPYWMFDLTSTQQAVGKPLELPPYRYGGMAYRGPDPFLKGKLDVLTSAGLDRKSGDQKPARWVDLTGSVADGSEKYGGAVIFDHPSNPHHPTPARIHPTTIPFFAFTPSHDRALTIPADRPTVFRYRVVIHDGHPNRERNERLWNDFADPPVVTVLP